jgi:hypothetical protein
MFMLVIIVRLNLLLMIKVFLDEHWRCLTECHLIVHCNFIVDWICISFFICTIWDICTSGGNILTIGCICIYISNRSRLNILIRITSKDRRPRLSISLLMSVMGGINNSLAILLVCSVISRLRDLIGRSVLILNVVWVCIWIKENRTLSLWTRYGVSDSCIKHDWFIAVDRKRLFILRTSPR